MTEKRSKMPINSLYEEAVKDQKILTSESVASAASSPLQGECFRTSCATSSDKCPRTILKELGSLNLLRISGDGA